MSALARPLWRSATGEVIHTDVCPVKGAKGVVWRYSEGKSDEQSPRRCQPVSVAAPLLPLRRRCRVTARWWPGRLAVIA